MKMLKLLFLTLFFAVSTASLVAQTCTADGSVSLTSNPGEVLITDNSTTSSGIVFSWIEFYNNTTSQYAGSHYFQSAGSPTTQTFSQNGVYSYYISVEDTVNGCYDSIGGNFTISNIPTSCDASFTSSMSGCNVMTYDAFNTGYSDYYWSFGDGTTSQNIFGTHTYTTDGTYTIELAVYDYDSLGNYLCGDTTYQTVTVNCGGCYANANVSVSQTGTPGLLSVVDNSTSSTPTSFSWMVFYDQSGTWLGNVPLQPNANSGTFQVPSNGIYNYSFVVQDSTNTCEDSISNVITVNSFGSSSCDANFNYYPDSVGNSVYFDAPTHFGSGYSYFWDFGDGNTSSSIDPIHNYGANGTYTACLTVWNNNNFCSDTVCNTITVANGGTAGCTGNANFTYNVSNGNEFFFAPNTILSNASYSWDFGNGSSSSTSVCQQTYNVTSSGWYAVCLIVIDGNNCTDYYCDSVYVTAPATGPACDAMFYAYPDSSAANQVQFYAYGNNGSGAIYSWNYGDGNSGTGQNASHTYTTSGWYAACLTVTDNSGTGCAQTYCDSVYADGGVTTPSCNADFILFQDSTGSGVYYAWNTSTGSNLSYFWDFGDGNSSTSAYPTHTYTSVGVYGICLSVSDNNGCANTFCDTIYITVKSAGTTLNVLAPGATVGVKEVIMINNVNLYPNPTYGEFNLSVNASESFDATIFITNLMGQTVESISLQMNQGENFIKMNESDLSSGIYLVNLVNELTGETSSMKLIKE